MIIGQAQGGWAQNQGGRPQQQGQLWNPESHGYGQPPAHYGGQRPRKQKLST